MRGTRGDRAFFVGFGLDFPDGGAREVTRAGLWTPDWNVHYFPADPRSVALNESDESGNLCDCETQGSPSTGYTCAPRVWLADGGAYSGFGTGPCVSLDDDLWISNGIFTWLFVGSAQTRLVPRDGGLQWDRVHVAGGHVVVSGLQADGYRTVVLDRDAGFVHELPVSPPGAVAEATRASRKGVVAGFLGSRPVIWPRLFGGEFVEVALPNPGDGSRFAFVSVSDEASFCALENEHAVFYLSPGALPLVDEALGFGRLFCAGAMSGGRFVVAAQGGGITQTGLLRVTPCAGDCRD